MSNQIVGFNGEIINTQHTPSTCTFRMVNVYETQTAMVNGVETTFNFRRGREFYSGSERIVLSDES
jgi:hypothetical protein